jgi:hypothetical protein
MNRVTLLTVILLVIFSNATLAQKRIYYHKNTFDRTFTKCENPPKYGNDSLDLQKYFSDKLHNEIPNTAGQIKISILIDTSGKTACEWIENDSNLKINKAKLNLLIDTMPNWNCGIQNGYKVNCSEIVVLTFNREHLAVANRIGTE